MSENSSRPVELQALQTPYVGIKPVEGCSNLGAGTSGGAKMRILHLISALPIGDAEIMLWRLLSAFSPTCSHAVVSLKDEGSVGPKILDLGAPLYTLRLRPAVGEP